MMLKVPVPNLKIGMFVAQLDRPWLETPFLFQGFYIHNQNDIEILKQHCNYVYVDAEKQERDLEEFRIFSSSSQKKNRDKGKLPTRHCEYEDKIPVEDEIGFAKQCRESLNKHCHKLFVDISEGKTLDLSRMEESIDKMVASVIRNPDAFLWLTKLKNLDNYAYNHAIDTSVLAASFGRHLGLNQSELKDLATGVLLCDIGKVKLPQAILSKPGRLSEREFDLIKTHVELSVEILETAQQKVSREIIKIARFHHERHNGHGYLNGLSGPQIPVMARICAIVDCYDAITTHRVYNRALSPLEAIKCMYEWRDIDFQKDLVEEFIQCLGIFPTGSVVELSSGEVGIVIAQNRIRRLRPRVMLVLDSEHRSLDHLPVIDLVHETRDKSNRPLEIIRTHSAGAFGIDPANFFIQD